MGLDVPDDLSIVGFDDTALATSVWPELTTVKQPISAMAEAALELLIADLRSRRRRGPAQVRRARAQPRDDHSRIVGTAAGGAQNQAREAARSA